MDSQTLKFDEVIWAERAYYGNAAYIALVRETNGNTDNLRDLSSILNVNMDLHSAPAGLDQYAAMGGDNGRKPYWVFSYKFDSLKGFAITDVKVKDTISNNSTEDVIEKIEFSDLKVFFNDSNHLLNLGALVSGNDPQTFIRFSIGNNGTCRGDNLFQRGLIVEIITNVLSSSGGVCTVKLNLSVVFRGAKNDFDPGGVPVALGIWPQFAYTWVNSEDTTKRVEKFMGSVKTTFNNKMHHSHAHHGAQVNKNIPSFFTDSNTSVTSDIISVPKIMATSRGEYYSGFRGRFAAYSGLPFGWANVFDYNKLNPNSEFEIDAVYGPNDGDKFRSSIGREQRYRWIDGIRSPGLRVRKANRQGMYDNIHMHGHMGNDDKGNIQVHAPFCGHSCMHFHWRWSNISSEGQRIAPQNYKYRGWGLNSSNSLADAPLIPPNQKLKIALCRFDANNSNGGNSFSDEHILNPSALNSLDQLRKMVWYRTEIIHPDAGQKQVALEHGLGWAYRYATTLESDAVRDLLLGAIRGRARTPITDQDVIMQKFRDDIYPDFRYKDNDNQVPEGDHDILYDSGNSGTSMEDL